MAPLRPRQLRRQEVMANREQARRINAQPGIAAEQQRLQQAQQMVQGPREPVARPGVPMTPLEGTPQAAPDYGMQASPNPQQVPQGGMGYGTQQSGMGTGPVSQPSGQLDQMAMDKYIQHLQRYAPGGNNRNG